MAVERDCHRLIGHFCLHRQDIVLPREVDNKVLLDIHIRWDASFERFRCERINGRWYRLSITLEPLKKKSELDCDFARCLERWLKQGVAWGLKSSARSLPSRVIAVALHSMVYRI